MSAARLGLTVGDPMGIGPEVACKALLARIEAGRPADVVLVGEEAAIARWAGQTGLAIEAVDELDAPCTAVPAQFVRSDEPVEVASIRQVVAACMDGRLAGLVTGPIHKQRLADRGFPFAGHTGFLGHLCGVDGPVMAFVGGSLRVALVTVHMPLRAVADALTQARVANVLQQVHQASARHLGLAHARLAVCGLNPHAGDGGLLGSEEQQVIAPAIAAARAVGIDAVGPVSAEVAFRQAARGDTDWVIAMYHDQGLAPLKLVDFGRSVNWTLGLPIVRTSVDHGTADDIAGQGIANPDGMGAAIALAERLTDSSRPR